MRIVWFIVGGVTVAAVGWAAAVGLGAWKAFKLWGDK